MLDKKLFSSFAFDANTRGSQTEDREGDDDDSDPVFRISLESLLGTLQLFGVSDTNDRWTGRDPSYGGVTSSMYRGGPSAAFESRALGMSGLCKLEYAADGAPFSITLEESGVTTTCELTTYEQDPFDEIPMLKDTIQIKIIMRASLLFDAIEELSATSPTRLSIAASPTAPHLLLSASGAHGSASVEFSKVPQLLDIFHVRERWFNVYKFAYVKGAMRAMTMASMVSIRGDEQGVLNLQFMMEMEDELKSFVDFRFVPFLVEDGEDENGEEDFDNVSGS